jgi:hypothetical protein
MNRRKMLQQAATAIAGLCLLPCAQDVQTRDLTSIRFVGSKKRGYEIKMTPEEFRKECRLLAEEARKNGIATTTMEFQLV